MATTATDNQKRAIKLLSRKYPDTVQPLLDERGGIVDKLTYKQAHEIMEVVGEKHPYKRRGDQRDQQREQRQQQDQQRERERLEREREVERLRQQERQRLREEERENERDEQDELDEQDEQDQQDDDNQQKEQKEDDLKDQQKFAPRKGSKQEFIANALKANDLDVEKTRAALAEQVGQIPQLTFMGNIDGGRQRLPMGVPSDDSQQETQHGRCLKTLFAVRRQLMLGGDGKREQKYERQQRQHDQREDKEQRDNRTAIELLAWVRQMRTYCKDKAADGKPLDVIGLRPVESGAAMLKQGIPLAAIKHALTLHFPPEARRALGVRDFDVLTHKPKERQEGVHGALPYCLDVVSARDHDGMRLLLTLIGGKGTGKTTLAKQIAEHLQLPFGFVSMTSGTSPSAFNGRPMVADDGTGALIAAMVNMSQIEGDDAKALAWAQQAMRLAKQRHAKGDTVMSQFVKIYGGGGVFLFDELDAADENLLLGLNAALANGKFANPATGKIIEQHPDFIAIAGMNTMGLGATRDHGARNRLDAATLDRWNPGRVIIELDPRIEESMFWDIVNR
jgi:hypothetical protein